MTLGLDRVEYQPNTQGTAVRSFLHPLPQPSSSSKLEAKPSRPPQPIILVMLSLGTYQISKTSTFWLTLTAFLFKSVLYIIAQICPSWTTLGILASEREYLDQLPERFESMKEVQGEDRGLPDDSLEHMKEFGRIRLR